MKQSILVSVCLLSLALAAGAYIAQSDPSAERATLRPGLRARGHVSGLFPGARSPLRVSVRSRLPFAVRLTGVSAKAQAPGRGCLGRNVSVEPYSGRMRIPAHRSRRVTLLVRMAPAAPDACQGARFPLRYTVSARR